MFYRPIKSAITNKLHVGILTGMWHLITIHFTLSAVALLVLGAYGHLDAVAWLIAATIRLLRHRISLHIVAPRRSFQALSGMPFAATAILAAAGALTAHSSA